MGSGKSAVGRAVARSAGAPHHDLDAMIEDRVGMTIARLFEERGEEEFRRLESELLAEALEAGAVVSLGGGAPMRDENWRLIRERALSVWLDLPVELALERLRDRSSRPLLHHRTEDEARALLDSRIGRYREADHRVDAARPVKVVTDEVLALWRA